MSGSGGGAVGGSVCATLEREMDVSGPPRMSLRAGTGVRCMASAREHARKQDGGVQAPRVGLEAMPWAMREAR